MGFLQLSDLTRIWMTEAGPTHPEHWFYKLEPQPYSCLGHAEDLSKE